MRLNSILPVVLCLLAVSCVDRFIPPTTGYEQVVFIECLLADDSTENAAVKISLSAPVATTENGRITFKPAGVSGAEVTILCSDGNRYDCSELSGGNYALPSNFRALHGKTYKLNVQYGDLTFESDYAGSTPSPPVDSITWKAAMRKESESGAGIRGYRFYVSTHQSDEGQSWYRYTMQADYRFEVPYLATHTWNGRTTVAASNRELRTCWKSKSISGIYLAKTSGLEENRVINAPLNFESQYGDELSIRYSLKVRQYAISESAYRFWEDAGKLISETGGLYETQPFRLEGNIRCTSDTTIYVVGIFEVAGVSTKRIFLDKPLEFPVTPVECILSEVGTRDFPWYRLPAGSFVTQDLTTGKFYTSSPSCYDCRLREATLEKPPFWID